MRRAPVISCLLAAAGLAAAAALAGAASPPGSAANPIRATTSATAGFSPRVVTVRPGAVVRFRNVDRARHNAVHYVVSGRPRFSSGPPTRGDFRLRAPVRPGRYDYVCRVHGFMRGVLVVRR
jgi:plastocyanin